MIIAIPLLWEMLTKNGKSAMMNILLEILLPMLKEKISLVQVYQRGALARGANMQVTSKI